MGVRSSVAMWVRVDRLACRVRCLCASGGGSGLPGPGLEILPRHGLLRYDVTPPLKPHAIFGLVAQISPSQVSFDSTP